jgi:hypothetical protein
MNDAQIEEKLQVIEDKYPHLFTQHKLKQHIKWTPVEGADKLTWMVLPQFAGNLPAAVKIEISKAMNPLTKSGYEAPGAEKAAAKAAEKPAKTEEEETTEETTIE